MTVDLANVISGVAAFALVLLVNDARASLREIRDELRATQSRLAAHELAEAAQRQRCEDRHPVPR